MSTHTSICYHIVFATRGRTPVLHPGRRPDLFRYMWGIIKNRDGHLYRLNGVEDHLRIFTSLHPTVSLADLVKDLKTGSARWIKQNRVFKQFSHWQEGYAAFTRSWRDRDGLIEYIKRQEEHHRRTTFEEEYRKLLVEAGIEFDERSPLVGLFICNAMARSLWRTTFRTVMLSPFALPLRTALSAAKGLRVNFAKHLAPKSDPEERPERDSSLRCALLRMTWLPRRAESPQIIAILADRATSLTCRHSFARCGPAPSG